MKYGRDCACVYIRVSLSPMYIPLALSPFSSLNTLIFIIYYLKQYLKYLDTAYRELTFSLLNHAIYDNQRVAPRSLFAA